jgi:hypothetical protein
MKKSTLLLVALALALVFSVWRTADRSPPSGETGSQKAVAAAPDVPAEAATVASVKTPPTRESVSAVLLEALRALLARRDVRPHETVLQFKDDAALARFLSRAGKAGLDIIGRLDALHAVRVRYSDLGGLRSELADNAADYSGISGNYLFNVPQVPAKEDRPNLNQIPFGNDALAFIGASGDRSSWGRGVTIAVLDTGVATDRTFGSGRVGWLDIGLGTAPGRGGEDGHGTSVASLAAGASPDAAGVAPAADILSIRVTDAKGTSDIFTLAQAIVTAADAGAKVINVSMGGYATNSTLSAAIGYAMERGAVIVAAAGNDQASQLSWPAADPRVVSVGAVDKAEQQVSFSNSGPQLNLAAPGYGVQTAWLDGNRAIVDGTSASAPIVAGSIAALLSQNPTLTAAQAAELLRTTANDAGAPGADPSFGSGIVNLSWAMNANNPTYVDTAISSHYFDPASNTMQFVVQNRSGHAVSGLSLIVTANAAPRTYPIATMSAGQTQVFTMPVDNQQLNATGQIQYTTTLTNPTGVTDQLPANNRRSSVLSAPKK